MLPKLSPESSPALRPLIDEEKAWFQNHKWGQDKLVECYATVMAGIDDFVETLDRGNASRLTAHHAKAAAIRELVPDVENLVLKE